MSYLDTLKKYKLLNEGGIISADHMEIAGKKLINKVDIGSKFHGELRDKMKHTSKKVVLTVTGFGPRANAFRVYKVEDEDKQELYLRVDVMYGVSYKVADNDRGNWDSANGLVLDKIVLESVDEMSTSAGAGGYETPMAFGELGDDTIEMMGYKKVKKVKKEVKDVKESQFKRMSREMFINEISYNEYRKDPIATPKQKINQSINFINKGLKEIEKVVNHNVRLKQEMGVDNGIYWKSSRENLIKISERLVRVSKQLKELGS